MAENKILLKIGSVFSGEGLKKTEEAVRKTADQSKKAQGAITALSNQMGAMGGQAGKVAGIAGNVAGSFKEMGAAGGLAAAAVVSLNLVLDHLKQELDKMVKAGEAAAAYQEKMANKAFQDHLSNVTTALKTMRDVAKDVANQFDLVAQNAAKIEAAKVGTVAANASQKLAKMEWDAAIARMQTADEATKKLVDAQWKLAIQREREAQDNEAAAAKERAAETALGHAYDRQALATDTLTQARDALAVAEKEEALAKRANKEKAKAFTKAREDAEAAVKAAEIELAKATTDVTVAEESLKQATAATETVRIKGQTATAGLEDAERELQRATNEEKRAREERAKKISEGEKEAGWLLQEQKSVEARGGKEIKSLEDGIKKQIQLLQEIVDLQEKANNGMAADQSSHNGTFGPYQYDLNKDGSIADFEDFQRAMRYANGRGANNERTRQRNAERSEQEMYDLLGKRDSGQYMSDKDKRRLQELIDFDKQKKDKANEEAKLKAMQAEKERREKELQDNVKKIKEKITECLAVK